MNGRTLSLIIIALIGGILIGNSPDIKEWVSLFPIMIALGSFVIRFFISRRKPFHNFNLYNDVTAYFLFVGIGIISSASNKPVHTEFIKGEYSFSGTIRDYTPTSYGDKLLVELSHLCLIPKNEKPIKLNVRNVNALITLEDATYLNYGDYISGSADLKPVDYPSNFRNDDYTAYLKRKGIFLSGYTDASKCRISYNNVSFFSFFLTLRDRLEIAIESTLISESAKSFLISVLLGDKTYINREDRITFSDAGVAHIFAVSGLHVSLIGFGIAGILSLLLFGRSKNWKYLICIPLIWFYILLVGFSPATCRAGIMITIAFMAFFLQRKHNALKALGWSVVLILSFIPSALFDIGFQLSVVCVGSLILIASPLNFVDHRANPKLFTLVSLILVSLTATFSTWLICAFYFHRFSFMFLPLNLIAVPLLPFYLVIALFYIVCFNSGLNFPHLASLIDWLYDSFQNCATFVTSVSSPVDNIHPHSISVLCWLIGLLLLAWFLQSQRKKIKNLVPSLIFFSFSILSLFLISASFPEGFIVQKNNSLLSIMSYHDGKESQLLLPEGAVVKTVVNGKRFVAVRTMNLSKEAANSLKDADYVMIGKGCKNLPENLESCISENATIITHPSLHWRYEKTIIWEANDKNLTLHSLRYDGPLHVFKD